MQDYCKDCSCWGDAWCRYFDTRTSPNFYCAGFDKEKHSKELRTKCVIACKNCVYKSTANNCCFKLGIDTAPDWHCADFDEFYKDKGFFIHIMKIQGKSYYVSVKIHNDAFLIELSKDECENAKNVKEFVESILERCGYDSI